MSFSHKSDPSSTGREMLRWLWIAVLTAILIVDLYALQFLTIKSFFKVAGIGIVAAGAFLFLGLLLGFVFAIPRTGKNFDRARTSNEQELSKGSADFGDKYGNSNEVEINNNLSDISDWLTKIVVGVGLVELNKLPYGMKQLASYIGAGLSDCDSVSCVKSSEALALTIIIFFAATGFLIGYIWTTLSFMPALSTAITNLKRKMKQEMEENLERRVKDLELSFQQSSVAQDDVAQAEKTALIEEVIRAGVLSSSARENSAQMGKTDLDKAVLEIEKAAEEKLYEKLDKGGALDEANRLVDAALQAVPDNPLALINKARILKRMAMKLGGPKKGNLLKQAISHVTRVAELYPHHGSPFYNMACYQTLLNVDRPEIYRNLRRAFELNPQLRRAAAEDPDLESLREDAEFKELTQNLK